MDASPQIVKKNTFPLRYMKSQGVRYLCTPYERVLDNVTMGFFNNDNRIAHYELVSTDSNPGFKRNILWSKTDGKNIATMSGYLYTGKIDVYAWKTRSCPDQIEDREREGIEILSLVEMMQVFGDVNNITGGLEYAADMHKFRTTGLKLYELTMEDVKKFHNAMIHHLPN